MNDLEVRNSTIEPTYPTLPNQVQPMQLSFTKHSLTQSWTDVIPGIKSSWPSVFQVVPSLKQLLPDTMAISVVEN